MKVHNFFSKLYLEKKTYLSTMLSRVSVGEQICNTCVTYSSELMTYVSSDIFVSSVGQSKT